MNLEFSKKISVNDRSIGSDEAVYIIAEAGVNHNGDMELAKQLIEVAMDSGVDAVKFQSFKTEHLILEGMKKADYQIVQTGGEESQFEMLKRLEIDINQTKLLKDHCDKLGIQFLTTPFDEFSLDKLDELDLPAYKISSTDTTNLPFLIKVAQKGKPIILSTGMCFLNEVEEALQTIHPHNKELVLLQCTSNYPTPLNEVNLNVMSTYAQNFDVLIGFSDHTEGIGASPYSVAKGAVLVEKHFTLDKTMEGPDHAASLSPEELKSFVKSIRAVEQMKGSYEKAPTNSELNSRQSMQKCLVASRPIDEGEDFSLDNLTGKRTGGQGISAFEFRNVIGRKANRAFKSNEIIEL